MLNDDIGEGSRVVLLAAGQLGSSLAGDRLVGGGHVALGVDDAPAVALHDVLGDRQTEAAGQQ